MNTQPEYKKVTGYIVVTCPDGQSFDAFLEGIKGMYTTVSSCYGDKTVKVYFFVWQDVKEPTMNELFGAGCRGYRLSQ